MGGGGGGRLTLNCTVELKHRKVHNSSSLSVFTESLPNSTIQIHYKYNLFSHYKYNLFSKLTDTVFVSSLKASLSDQQLPSSMPLFPSCSYSLGWMGLNLLHILAFCAEQQVSKFGPALGW